MLDAKALADVQGFILRSYGMDALRVFALRVNQVAESRLVLGRLSIASGTPWESKPDFCINLGITYVGLQALQLPRSSLDSFPKEFRLGAVNRAPLVGDTGDSAPEQWIDAFINGDIHVLITLYAQDARIRETQSRILRSLWGEAMTEVMVKDADMLPGNVAHFGFRDGFSQPTIDGGLPNPFPDRLPKAPAGEFLLGYPSQFRDFTYPIPQPEILGFNGSFLAFRILEQDCAAFEKLLSDAPTKFGIGGEKLAAKMVGRWRNGTPLHASPETDKPVPPLSTGDMNNYDYLDDTKGLRCPVGSHMRRNNPRGSAIAGGVGTNHRIVRRGLPYGPMFDPGHPDDGVGRGLLGLFIMISLKDQFEFLMSEWVNGSIFAAGLSGSKDPIVGDNSNETGKFIIPIEAGKPIIVSGFSRLVKVRGSSYAFLPSLSAIRYISQLA